jgi:hypothetical protein
MAASRRFPTSACQVSSGTAGTATPVLRYHIVCCKQCGLAGLCRHRLWPEGCSRCHCSGCGWIPIPHPWLLRPPAAAANDLTDVISPSCYSCFDYPNATGGWVGGWGWRMGIAGHRGGFLTWLCLGRGATSVLKSVPSSSCCPLAHPPCCSRPGDWVHGCALSECRHDLPPAIPHCAQRAGAGAAGRRWVGCAGSGCLAPSLLNHWSAGPGLALPGTRPIPEF